MTATPSSAQDDLAFLRALVQPGNILQRGLGESYLAAGLCYGVQMLLSAAQVAGLIPATQAVSLTVAIGPTAVFIVLLIAIVGRTWAEPPTGSVGKAIGAVFGCIGAANLALIAVIGLVALRQHSLTTWLIYPCAAFVLQGAAWLVSYSLRRRPWHGVIGLGWFATAVVMAWFVQSTTGFILVTGAGLILFMLTPGWVMMRHAARHA
jgi:hypothetical protein